MPLPTQPAVAQEALVKSDDDMKEAYIDSELVGPIRPEPVLAPVDDKEPIVTRRELWSYYRALTYSFP